MVYLHPFWDRTVNGFPGDAVHVFAVRLSVSIRAPGAYANAVIGHGRKPSGPAASAHVTTSPPLLIGVTLSDKTAPLSVAGANCLLAREFVLLQGECLPHSTPAHHDQGQRTCGVNTA